MARSIAGPISAIALLAFGASASAEPEAALKPRYSIEATRLEAAPSRETSDGRYRLDARLRPTETQHAGNGITLNAKLVAAATTACDSSGLIFADGFE